MTLEEGQIVGLLGRNGVGKTTMVNSLVGFNHPRRGRILFKGQDITHTPSFATVRLGMGLVPQGRRVFPTLSVEENLKVAQGGNNRQRWTLNGIYELFPRLLERQRQRAKTLSGGEQQMLAIGRGLMTNPDCLIMDEPSEGLAPLIIRDVWDVISKLKREGRIVKAMVVDCDVHQGDGTAFIFHGDPSVFTCSIHQEDLYPEIKQQSDLDIGLLGGTGDDVYLEELSRHFLPALEIFHPHLLIFVAGADPYQDDQEGGLRLTLEGLERRDQIIFEEARRKRVPVVVVLAGGYAQKTADTVTIHVNTIRTGLEIIGRGKG